MPKVSEFFGITIYMFYDDHPEPHFHASYEGREVKVRISDLSVIAGGLSARAVTTGPAPVSGCRWRRSPA